MKKILFLFAILSIGAAQADTYSQVATDNTPRILITGPDTFKNRLRYWMLMDDGNPTAYEVVEKNRKGEWVDVMHPAENPVLLFSGNSLRVERRNGNKVISVEQYEKVAR